MSAAELLGLDGQVCLVTAAGSGIGRATAMQFGRAGCSVAAVDTDARTARETAEQITSAGGRAIAVQADATDRDDVTRAIRMVRESFGPLDIAANVVGGSLLKGAFLDLTRDDFERVLERNLISTIICCQCEAVAMIEDGRPGRIVNVASTSGVRVAPTITPYGAAKAAVIHLTKSIAVELAPYGLRINCVVPGTHASPRTVTLATDPGQTPGVREFWRRAAEAPLLGRLGDPVETAGVIVFLASELSSYMTGHAVLSDGGVIHTTGVPAVGGEMVPEALSHVAGLRARGSS